MAASKAAAKIGQGEPMSKFGEYDLDLLKVPAEARPRTGQFHLGKHGYTISSKTGADLC